MNATIKIMCSECRVRIIAESIWDHWKEKHPEKLERIQQTEIKHKESK